METHQKNNSKMGGSGDCNFCFTILGKQKSAGSRKINPISVGALHYAFWIKDYRFRIFQKRKVKTKTGIIPQNQECVKNNVFRKGERMKRNTKYTGYAGLVLKVLGWSLRMDRDAIRDDALPLRSEDLGRINKVLAESLFDKEKKVIEERFGLGGCGSYTFNEIAPMLGCTPARVMQIENKAIRKLRHVSRIWVFEHCSRAGLERRIERLQKEKMELENKFPNGYFISLDELDLSVRTHNALRHQTSVATLGDLTQKTELDILRLRNCGRSNVFELKAILAQYGLKFKDAKEMPKGISLDSHVRELNLSVRAFNTLRNAEIATIRDLTEKRECDMLKYRNFGRKSLNEIKESMSRYGFKFKE